MSDRIGARLAVSPKPRKVSHLSCRFDLGFVLTHIGERCPVVYSLCCGIVVALGKNTLTYLMVMVKLFQLSWMSLLLRKQRKQLYRALRMVLRSGSAPPYSGARALLLAVRACVHAFGSAVRAVAQCSVYYIYSFSLLSQRQ